jgi:hypothetical protein
MQQFFTLVNSLLQGDPKTARRRLSMVVYKVRLKALGTFLTHGPSVSDPLRHNP